MMITKDRKKSEEITSIERGLLIVFFLVIPFFYGSITNTGFMLWQLITFTLTNIRIARQIFYTGKINRPSLIETIVLIMIPVSFFHFLFSVNRYNTFFLFMNIIFGGLFFAFYLKQMPKNDLKKIPFLFLPGFTVQVLLGIVQLLIDPGNPVHGGFLDPNYYSLYLIIGALLLCGIVLFGPIERIYKLAGYAFLPVIFILIIYTQSRSATPIFLLAFSFILFLKRQPLVLIGAALIALMIFIPNPYKKHIEQVHLTDPYAYERLNIYRMDLEMFADHFLIGVGLGCFTDYSPVYKFPHEGVIGRYRVTTEQAHNSYFHWIIEYGIPGFIPLLMFFSLVIRDNFLNIRSVIKKKNERLYNPGADISILAISTISLIHNALYNNAIVLLFLVLIAYSGCFAYYEPKRKDTAAKVHIPNNKKKWVSVIWIILFVETWYFLIHTSWLSSYYLNAGIFYCERSDFEYALKNFDKSLSKIPFNTKTLLLRADTNMLLFLKTGNLDYAFLALKDYDRGLEYAERSGDLRMNKIHTLIAVHNLITEKNPSAKLQDLEEEITLLFKELFSMHPKKVFYYHDYADYLCHKNDLIGAASVLENALILEPNYVSAHRMLSIIYEKLHNTSKSQEHRNAAEKIAKTYDRNQYRNDSYLFNLLK